MRDAAWQMFEHNADHGKTDGDGFSSGLAFNRFGDERISIYWMPCVARTIRFIVAALGSIRAKMTRILSERDLSFWMCWDHE